MEKTFGVSFTELLVLVTAFAVYSTRAALYLNNSELKTPLLTFKTTLLTGGSSLSNCHKLPNVSE